MYNIERKQSGYILTFSGTVSPNEMLKWKEESEQALATEFSKSFGVIIDMRKLLPLTAEANTILVEGQKLYKNKGMQRSVVILNNKALCEKLKNVAIQSGIYSTERYIDASAHAAATQMAVKWVKDGIDPDGNK